MDVNRVHTSFVRHRRNFNIEVEFEVHDRGMNVKARQRVSSREKITNTEDQADMIRRSGELVLTPGRSEPGIQDRDRNEGKDEELIFDLEMTPAQACSSQGASTVKASTSRNMQQLLLSSEMTEARESSCLESSPIDENNKPDFRQLMEEANFNTGSLSDCSMNKAFNTASITSSTNTDVFELSHRDFVSACWNSEDYLILPLEELDRICITDNATLFELSVRDFVSLWDEKSIPEAIYMHTYKPRKKYWNLLDCSDVEGGEDNKEEGAGHNCSDVEGGEDNKEEGAGHNCSGNMDRNMERDSSAGPRESWREWMEDLGVAPLDDLPEGFLGLPSAQSSPK